MIISICIPCMNRAYDLINTLPQTLEAAEASPPVEIAVLDYNSDDGLQEYMDIRRLLILKPGNRITYNRYEGRDYYHLAHAWNLAARLSIGEYVVIAGADALFGKEYIATLRGLIAEGAVWIRGRHFKGIVCVQRREFIEAGGYDERFEFYGGEDKELEARLKRRGAPFGLLPDGLVSVLQTSNEDKLSNYRLPLSKREMMERGAAIRAENDAARLTVANRGQAWGTR